jgi:hypothetical protein
MVAQGDVPHKQFVGLNGNMPGPRYGRTVLFTLHQHDNGKGVRRLKPLLQTRKIINSRY